MIQRIQSLMLLLAAGLPALLFRFPFLKQGDDGLYIKEDNVSLIITVAAMVISFLAIFLFKNRGLQSRVTRIAALLITALMAYFVYQYFTLREADANIAAGWIYPILSLILLFRAKKAIDKDEKLVKSVDRLR